MKKPTIPEIQERIDEKGYLVDAEEFFHFHESKGWKVGKNPMKNWKSAITTWWIRGGRKMKVNAVNNRHAQWDSQCGDWLRNADKNQLQTLGSFRQRLREQSFREWAEWVNPIVKEI